MIVNTPTRVPLKGLRATVIVDGDRVSLDGDEEAERIGAALAGGELPPVLRLIDTLNQLIAYGGLSRAHVPAVAADVDKVLSWAFVWPKQWGPVPPRGAADSRYTQAARSELENLTRPMGAGALAVLTVVGDEAVRRVAQARFDRLDDRLTSRLTAALAKTR